MLLKNIKKKLLNFIHLNKISNNIKSAIILHLYYPDLWDEFKGKILPLIDANTHLYVTLTDNSENILQSIQPYAQDVFILKNKGMDVAPFIYSYLKIKDLGYEAFLKIHSKKSLHTPQSGDSWRQQLYYPLVQNYCKYTQILNRQNVCSMLGVSSFCLSEKQDLYKTPVQSYINKLCAYLELSDNGKFYAGTMFMVNDIYMKRMFGNCDLIQFYEMFEDGYLRDSLAHGMERVFGYGVNHYSGKYINI